MAGMFVGECKRDRRVGEEWRERGVVESGRVGGRERVLFV